MYNCTAHTVDYYSPHVLHLSEVLYSSGDQVCHVPAVLCHCGAGLGPQHQICYMLSLSEQVVTSYVIHMFFNTSGALVCSFVCLVLYEICSVIHNYTLCRNCLLKMVHTTYM